PSRPKPAVPEASRTGFWKVTPNRSRAAAVTTCPAGRRDARPGERRVVGRRYASGAPAGALRAPPAARPPLARPLLGRGHRAGGRVDRAPGARRAPRAALWVATPCARAPERASLPRRRTRD